MSEPKIGHIEWRDLTVPYAEEVARFYEAVVGWTASRHSEDCRDFNMSAPDGEVVAGCCYAEGTNAGLPPHWLMYVRVADVDAAAKTALAKGGDVVDGPRQMGPSRFCVVKDPAGAYLALISNTSESAGS